MTDTTTIREDQDGSVDSSLATQASAFLARHEGALWGLVIAVTVADGVLTYAGLVHGYAEGNPVVRSAISQFGYVGIGAVKVLALGVALGVRSSLTTRRGAVVPLALMVPWASATVLNAITLAS